MNNNDFGPDCNQLEELKGAAALILFSFAGFLAVVALVVYLVWRWL